MTGRERELFYSRQQPHRPKKRPSGIEWAIIVMIVLILFSLGLNSFNARKASVEDGVRLERAEVFGLLSDIHRVEKSHFNARGHYFGAGKPESHRTLPACFNDTTCWSVYIVPDFGIIENKTPYTIVIEFTADGKFSAATATRNINGKEDVVRVDSSGGVSLVKDGLQ